MVPGPSSKIPISDPIFPHFNLSTFTEVLWSIQDILIVFDILIKSNHFIIIGSLVPMDFPAFLALEADFHLSVPDFIGDGVHPASALCRPISWYLIVYMERDEAIWTMIPAGLERLRNRFSAIDAVE